jgi:hypothetical protein
MGHRARRSVTAVQIASAKLIARSRLHEAARSACVARITIRFANGRSTLWIRLFALNSARTYRRCGAIRRSRAPLCFARPARWPCASGEATRQQRRDSRGHSATRSDRSQPAPSSPARSPTRTRRPHREPHRKLRVRSCGGAAVPWVERGRQPAAHRTPRPAGLPSRDPSSRGCFLGTRGEERYLRR